MKELSNNLFYIGVSDRSLDLFEGQYEVPNGMAYNSYIIKDEKIAIMDSVDKVCFDAVCDRLLYEILDNVVCIVAVSEDVLTAEEHLKLGVLHVVADGAESLPGIFLKEAQAGIEGRTAPCLERVVSDRIETLEDRDHFFGRHSGGGKRLMRVTQNGFGNQNFRHLFDLIPFVMMGRGQNHMRNTPAATAEPITPATFGPMACMSRKFAGFSLRPTS